MSTGHNAGAETTLHGVMLALRKAGHQTLVLASRPFRDGSGSYVLDGVKIQAFASKQDPFLHFPHHDIILTQLECAQRAWLLGRQLGKPTIQLVHNNTEYSRTIAERYTDYLVFNSEHIAKDLSYIDKPSVVMYPIVDPKCYNVQSSCRYITLINLSDGVEPFYDKGFRTFYELARRNPQLEFLGVKGAYGTQVIPSPLPANITIWEHTNNILDVYRQTAVLLMPSKTESYGRVAVEAACSGIPTISCDLPGPREAGVSYDYIDPKDYDFWNDTLHAILNNYPWISKIAEDKANDVWENTQQQLENFLQFVEMAVMDYPGATVT